MASVDLSAECSSGSLLMKFSSSAFWSGNVASRLQCNYIRRRHFFPHVADAADEMSGLGLGDVTAVDHSAGHARVDHHKPVQRLAARDEAPACVGAFPGYKFVISRGVMVRKTSHKCRAAGPSELLRSWCACYSRMRSVEQYTCPLQGLDDGS